MTARTAIEKAAIGNLGEAVRKPIYANPPSYL